MVAVVGFAMIICIVALLLKGKMSPIVVLTVIPAVAALILGHGPVEIADFIKEGVKTTTNNGILFIFSVIYFGVMSDTGMFDVIVNFNHGSDHDPSSVSCIQGNEDRHKDLTVPDWCMYGRYEPASLGRSGSACSNCSFYGC